MLTIQQLDSLAKRFGPFSSWAVWSPDNEADPTIIRTNIQSLNSQYVFVALNASADFAHNGDWANFRGGKHDRKLKFACNDTFLRGSYLTDLFKGVKQASSARFARELKKKTINENVSRFLEEMQAIGCTEETTFVILGTETSVLARLFRQYFAGSLASTQVVYYYHYAYYRLTDRQWVVGLWKQLGVKADFSQIRKRYK